MGTQGTRTRLTGHIERIVQGYAQQNGIRSVQAANDRIIELAAAAGILGDVELPGERAYQALIASLREAGRHEVAVALEQAWSVAAVGMRSQRADLFGSLDSACRQILVGRDQGVPS